MESFLPFLVVLVGAPVLVGVVLVLLNRRVPFAAGWALARWASGEPWRAPFLVVLLGLIALGVVVWAVRLQMPFLFVAFVVTLGAFLAGLTGVDDSEGPGRDPNETDPEWWRRTRR